MDLSRKKTDRLPRLRTSCVAAFLLAGCGGAATPSPQQPSDTAILEQGEQEHSSSDGKVLAASNEKVKQGMDALEAGDFSAAEGILASARQDSPQDAQAAHYHGVALEGLKKNDEAVSAYQKAIELQPKLIASSQNLSALLQQMGRNKESLAVADAGLEIDPQDPGLLINRAYAVDLLGEPQVGNPAAISAYETALVAAPENQNLKYYYAQALAANGEQAKALSVLGELPLDGKEVPVVEIVAVYNRLKAFKECTSVLSSQIEKEKSVELLVYRSSCRSGASDKKGAELDLRDAVKLDDNSPVAHYYLARFLDKLGKKAEAKKHLERANELKKAAQ